MKYFIFISLWTIVLISCDNKAKVISPSETNSTQFDKETSTGVFNRDLISTEVRANENSSDNSDVHHVKVLEVLPTEKYIYLKVVENEEEYWVAAGKQNVEVGDRYFFRGGLLKTNFESKEYNRVFEKVYLVSKLVSENHGQSSHNNTPSKEIKKDIEKVEGSLLIKEIIEQASALEGKEVQITGECTKLNANIMGRNWIHLKDGSKDDYDFIITSEQAIPEGHVATLKGTLALNRDFGSGYRYEILIENGTIVYE